MNIEYGTTVRLRHLRTTELLKSLDRKLPAPSISKQQMGVATDQASDPETHWVMKERYGSDDRHGGPVRNGDTIIAQASTQDQAAAAWVKLLMRRNTPTVPQAGDGVPAFEISVFIGARP